jgi:hypothetical protein
MAETGSGPATSRSASGVRDDRGRPCALAELSPRQVGVRALGMPALHDADTRRELAVTDRMELAVALAGGLAGAIAWQLMRMLVPVLGVPGLCGGFVIIPTAAAALAWRLSLGAIRRRRAGPLVAGYLASARCGACGYALAGLPPAADGCVVCPECSAAWRAERIAPGDSA